MKKESLVHLKALLEADHAVERVDINTEEDIIMVFMKRGERLVIYLDGYRELFAIWKIGEIFESRGEFE